MKVATLKNQLTGGKSAWERGVNKYAREILADLADSIARGYTKKSDLCNSRMIEKALLNGAQNWSMYSWGGMSLIYNEDICRRLATKTERNMTKNGQRRPNKREDWLDVQARALFQASRKITELILNQ